MHQNLAAGQIICKLHVVQIVRSSSSDTIPDDLSKIESTISKKFSLAALKPDIIADEIYISCFQNAWLVSATTEVAIRSDTANPKKSKRKRNLGFDYGPLGQISTPIYPRMFPELWVKQHT